MTTQDINIIQNQTNNVEQWFDEKLEVLNETLDVCRQQSAFGNVFLMLSDSDIEALKSGKVLHWAGETFKCGIFVRYEGVKKNVQPIEENNQENRPDAGEQM